MDHHEELWRGLLPRIRAKIKPTRPYYRTLFYSEDMNQYLDNDNPEAEGIPTTTIRQEAAKAGIKEFVCLPPTTGLTNYIEVGHTPAVSIPSKGE